MPASWQRAGANARTGGRRLGYTGVGAVVSWVPLFMFVFLFGMSMDYHVFILSRIRELRARGATAKDAVVDGISSSAGVVTSAAVIMVAVFSILATLSIIQLKMLGVSPAAAVLIDATVVRGVLVPAQLASLAARRADSTGRWGVTRQSKLRESWRIDEDPPAFSRIGSLIATAQLQLPSQLARRP